MNKNNKTEKFHVNITPLPNTRYNWDLLNILSNFVVRLILSHRASDVVIECFDLKDPSAKTVAATNPDNEAWRDLFTRCDLCYKLSKCYFLILGKIKLWPTWKLNCIKKGQETRIVLPCPLRFQENLAILVFHPRLPAILLTIFTLSQYT